MRARGVTRITEHNLNEARAARSHLDSDVHAFPYTGVSVQQLVVLGGRESEISPQEQLMYNEEENVRA